MAKTRKATPRRSAKAGPPQTRSAVPRAVARRRRRAAVAVKKDTGLLQTDSGTKVL